MAQYPTPPGGFRQAARQLPARTPLRVKLIAAVLALVTVALGVISVSGILFLRSYLLNQVDQELETVLLSSPPGVEHFLLTGQAQYESFSIQWLNSNGRVKQVAGEPTGMRYGRPPRLLPEPRVNASDSWLSHGHRASAPVTVSAVSGNGRWRVMSQQVTVLSPNGGLVGGTVIVGVDVTTIYRTLGELTVIDLIISCVLLAVLAVFGIAVIRTSLRPLTDIEQTAQAIAAGDLGRRVPERDPRTEVGRLGRSLNMMLAQIESAFRARTASEEAARRSEEAARQSALTASRSEARMRQFVADASHELRTPLTAIRGFAEYYRQRGGVASATSEPAGTPPTDATPAGATPAGVGPASPNSTDPNSTDPDGTIQNGTDPNGTIQNGTDPDGTDPDGTISNGSSSNGTISDGTISNGTSSNGSSSNGSSSNGSSSNGASANGASANGPSPADPDIDARLGHADLDRIIERVEGEAKRMGVLVDDMLLLARLDQQRALDARTVDLLAIAADALHDARMIAPSRDINLTVSTPEAALVIGDEVGLRQVVGNLVSNAMTHTPDGSPIDITIRAGTLANGYPLAPHQPAPHQPAPHQPAPHQPAEPAVILEVADRGPGLTAEQQEHVFERFYRTDRARTRKAGGTGLGLAIVAAMVSAHHGKVWVDSQPGEGATFGFALPLAPEARPAES